MALDGRADNKADRGEMNAEVGCNLRIAVFTGGPRRSHGGIVIRVGFRNRLQRWCRRPPLSTRNVDVIRPLPRSLVCASDKRSVTKKHLTVQMCPNRLAFHSLAHKLLVRRHGSRAARSKLRDKSMGADANGTDLTPTPTLRHPSVGWDPVLFGALR